MGGSDCEGRNKSNKTGIHKGDETDRKHRWPPAAFLEVLARFLTAVLTHLFSGLVKE
jgi:hypothetical protein